MNKQSLIYQLGKMMNFSDDYIRELENEYLQGNYDERYQLMDMLWKHFFKMMDDMIKVTYNSFLHEIETGKRSLTNDIYQQAVDYVKKFLLKSLEGTVDDELKIEEIRQKIMSYAGKGVN